MSKTSAKISTPERPAFELAEASIAELQKAMEDGQLTAAQLVAYYLDRIEQFDSQIKALICLNPAAKEQAVALDQERQAGQVRGQMHGIPIVVKDNINTAQMPTTGGCKALENLQPQSDAFVVARLQAAGAIVLGKANLHELACRGETASSLGGQTHNPYDLDYTPGGSSGGSAAAIAANLAAAGLGSDAVNSVRSPASACNIVGLRPTPGLVSRDGLMSVSLSQDVIGPMGRTVSDVAMLLDEIAIDDPQDPMTVRSTGRKKGGYQAALRKASLKKKGFRGMRLGIVRSLWGKDKVHQEVNELTEKAVSTMTSLGAGAEVVAVNIDVEKMFEELSLVMWEGKLHLNHYLESLGKSAPVNSLKAIIKSGKVHPSIEPLLKKMQRVEGPLGDAEYWQRCYARRVELRQHLKDIFQRYQLSALVYPHQKQLVAPIGEAQKDRNGFLAAASGFPAIAVPAGFSKSGLPVGIELMAQPFEETNLLLMAHAYEQATKWRRSPEQFA